MCDFCESNTFIDDEYDSFTAHIVELTPLTGINLTTGETLIRKEKPHYSLFVHEQGEQGECASFQIRFCPLCGKELSKCATQ